MADLVPCPLCGSRDGYKPEEGSTYRWWYANQWARVEDLENPDLIARLYSIHSGAIVPDTIKQALFP
jgi:hypothetical protein